MQPRQSCETLRPVRPRFRNSIRVPSSFRTISTTCRLDTGQDVLPATTHHRYFAPGGIFRAEARDLPAFGVPAEAPALPVPVDARFFFVLIAVSQCSIYVFAGTRLIAS